MWLPLLILASFGAARADTHLEVTRAARVDSIIAGGALVDKNTLLTWGTELRVWQLPALNSRLLAQGNFAGGACIVDLDGDGKWEFVSKEGPGLGNLVWRRGPQWEPEVVDTAVEMPDCLGVTLFGRRGFLTIHRFAQVRFYERPVASKSVWKYREIYSIYTPSQQSGLALHDVDRDGAPDIFCGNYWIKSPSSFDMPWRLFAINTYSEESLSARLAVVKIGTDQVVGQKEVNPARLTWFRRPVDPKQMWGDVRLSNSVRKVGGLTVQDLNGDQLPEVVVGENDGQRSRLLVYWNEGSHHFRETALDAGGGFLGLWSLTNKSLVAIHANHVALWGVRK